MDDRTDAPDLFDLSARMSDGDDALQVGASDFDAPKFVADQAPTAAANNATSKPAPAGLDAKLFDALVSPVAPVVMMQPESPAPVPEEQSSPESMIPMAEATSIAPEPKGRTGAWWTIPLLCAGLAIVACAVLVPAADENRRAMHELAKIEQDVAYFQKQSEVNKEFLERVSTDPTLAERLAMRQLRLARADARIVPMKVNSDPFSMSPNALVSVDPPTPLPEYRSISGFISEYFLDTKGQIYLAGLGILLTAAGVILGGGAPGNVECRMSSVE